MEKKDSKLFKDLKEGITMAAILFEIGDLMGGKAVVKKLNELVEEDLDKELKKEQNYNGSMFVYRPLKNCKSQHNMLNILYILFVANPWNIITVGVVIVPPLLLWSVERDKKRRRKEKEDNTRR